jgi:glucose-1-phosphate thymidylyltransferase
MNDKFRGVVLAGGLGTRLGMLTKATNKHLLPVGDEPMVYHGIRKLVGAGVTDITLVTGQEHAGHFIDLLGDGACLDCDLTYKVQQGHGGIAAALLRAEGSRDDERHVVVLLGDNIFWQPLGPLLREAHQAGAVLCLTRPEHPERYGVAVMVSEYDGADTDLARIVEKPEKAPSPYAVAGIYVYSPEVFDIIRDTCQPSKRGELEITDVNNRYLVRGASQWGVRAVHLQGYWTDAGTLSSLREANRLVLGQAPLFKEPPPASVAEVMATSPSLRATAVASPELWATAMVTWDGGADNVGLLLHNVIVRPLEGKEVRMTVERIIGPQALLNRFLEVFSDVQRVAANTLHVMGKPGQPGTSRTLRRSLITQVGPAVTAQDMTVLGDANGHALVLRGEVA